MKAMLFLGGGELGVSNLVWARNLGFTVIVNDRNSDAPGLKLADIQLSFDSRDRAGLKAWALTHNAELNIRYCHCGSDFGLLSAAEVHQDLGLPFPSPTAIRNGLNKHLMKTCWYQAAIPTPQHILVECPEALAIDLAYPLVVKPLKASGSQGVSVVTESDQLAAALGTACKYSSDGAVLIEEYLIGSHHDVNGLFWAGTFYPAGIGDRYFLAGPHPVPSHGYFPSTLPDDLQEQCYQVLERGARSMGIVQGPVKADLIRQGDQLYVLEISPRFHGDIFTSKVLGHLGQYNPLYQYFNLIGGTAESFQPIVPGPGVAGWKMVPNMLGWTDRKGLDGVFVKNRHQHSISQISNNDEIGGLIWAHAANRLQLDQILGIAKVALNG